MLCWTSIIIGIFKIHYISEADLLPSSGVQGRMDPTQLSPLEGRKLDYWAMKGVLSSIYRAFPTFVS
jgi:hypothetical protein